METVSIIKLSAADYSFINPTDTYVRFKPINELQYQDNGPGQKTGETTDGRWRHKA